MTSDSSIPEVRTEGIHLQEIKAKDQKKKEKRPAPTRDSSYDNIADDDDDVDISEATDSDTDDSNGATEA